MLDFQAVFLFSVILITRSSAQNSQYEACQPAVCRHGPNVSFPFYIRDQQQSYCSYPGDGFALTCGDNGYPVMNFSGNRYEIQHIYYSNQSMRVRLAGEVSGCVPHDIRNVTSPPVFFRFGSHVRNLSLFGSCDGDLYRVPGIGDYTVACDSRWNLAIPDTDLGLVYTAAMVNCEQNVFFPVEYAGDENGGRLNSSALLANGFEMRWSASECGRCERSGGRCGYNGGHFSCFCRDRSYDRTCNDTRHVRIIFLATLLPAAAMILGLGLLVAFLLWRQRRRNKTRGVHLRNTSLVSDVEGSSFHGVPKFSYKELQEATSDFHVSRELGDGGFGIVYYGKLRDGREVAVKRLYERNHRKLEQFLNEVKILTTLRHPNLVSLYGCTSRTSRELLLVYEYISNGTVANHLHGEKSKEMPLPWHIRMKIAVEAASALAYLHKSDIIHRDIKTENILLDENYCVKVADFGLSRLCPTNVTHISTAPQGTPGYVDPEYHQYYRLTDKSDVYSFGVVLMELISSMPAVDIERATHEINLANFATNRIQRCALHELIDPRLGFGSDPIVTDMASAVAELAFQCLHSERDMRPSMDETLRELKNIQGDGKQNEFYPNHEADDVKLIMKNKFLDSPKAVVDGWPNSSSTVASCHDEV